MLMPFSILNRYVIRELLMTWLAVLAVLSLVMLSSTLALLLGKAAEGELPKDMILPLLAVNSAKSFIMLMPLSLYLGVLLAFGRLYKDNEIAILNACGVGFRQLYKPLLWVVIPAAMMLSVMTLFVQPIIASKIQAMAAEIESRSEVAGIAPGRFNESRDSDTVLFVERQKEGQMSNVFLQQRQDEGAAVETAKRGFFITDEENRRYIVLEQGYRYEGLPGKADYRIVEFERHGAFIAEKTQVESRVKRDMIPTDQLWQSDNPQHRAELQWRLSFPLATLVISALALPLSHTSPRKGRYSKLVPAILIYLVYSNLLGAAVVWVERGSVPQWLGLWWVHGVFAVLAALLLVYHSGWRWSLMALRGKKGLV